MPWGLKRMTRGKVKGLFPLLYVAQCVMDCVKDLMIDVVLTYQEVTTQHAYRSYQEMTTQHACPSYLEVTTQHVSNHVPLDQNHVLKYGDSPPLKLFLEASIRVFSVQPANQIIAEM
ncbi:hypothetical protein FNV43_RR01748 [Rhamnella rubrinervis]|uniref:Uncharacterized protein n=1 Tax=Rhamnella rubrinervis TaxID=2594499 RepID=A0A8K0HR06_9ROSA|nr:hypothetical protein FNV43_RR01748 [Rhamnella rubrinervis]